MLNKTKLSILILIAPVLLVGCSQPIKSNQLANAISKDGTPISYSVYGEGETTIAFVHGWSCDSRYWHNQVSYFAKKYRVVTIDLAGHGHSGLGRKAYTNEAFAQDVIAVLEELDLNNVILVGHSMGGGVILKASIMEPNRIIGLIGVDTLDDMGKVYPEEVKRGFYEPLEADFVKNTKEFVRSMFPKNANSKLVNTIANDMSSAPRESALSALLHHINLETKELAKSTKVPLKSVNADFWPTNVEGNKELVPSYELALMKGYGHFIMLENPDLFNKLFEEMVETFK